MPVFTKAVAGFNHNIKHKGQLYHVQTEDSGVHNPHIITHLFVGGNIVASKKTGYAEILNTENLGQIVRELMEEQHKEMLRNLLNGAYDKAEQAHSYAPGQIAGGGPRQSPAATLEEAAHAYSHMAQALSQPEPPAAPRPEAFAAGKGASVKLKESTETLFGEDLISERSLDEVILAYLSGEAGEK